MSHLSDAIAENYRTGKPIKPKYGNKFSRARQNLYEEIKNRTGENPDLEMDYALQVVNDNVGQIQRYVLSQGEVPAKTITQLAQQAYKLRCNQIKAVQHSTGLNNMDAQILLETDESDDDELETSSKDTFLGQLAAPVGLISYHLNKPDNFETTNVAENLSGDVSNILTGVTGLVGSKISTADFKRAAQNKSAGILGALGTGGTSHYNALRSWFAQYPAIAKLVISGQIPDEASLYSYVMQQNAVSQGAARISPPPVAPVGATAINSNDVVQGVANYQTNQQIKRYLPVIIIGVIALVVIIVLVARKK